MPCLLPFLLLLSSFVGEIKERNATLLPSKWSNVKRRKKGGERTVEFLFFSCVCVCVCYTWQCRTVWFVATPLAGWLGKTLLNNFLQFKRTLSISGPRLLRGGPKSINLMVNIWETIIGGFKFERKMGNKVTLSPHDPVSNAGQSITSPPSSRHLGISTQRVGGVTIRIATSLGWNLSKRSIV